MTKPKKISIVKVEDTNFTPNRYSPEKINTEETRKSGVKDSRKMSGRLSGTGGASINLNNESSFQREEEDD
jgi:hypothetical protein